VLITPKQISRAGHKDDRSFVGWAKPVFIESYPLPDIVMKKPYFPALDGLRSLSVFLVIFVHIRTKSPWLAYIPGQLGVDIFFVLSGFLITTLLLREQEECGRIDLVAFYARRFFRIVPVYLLVLSTYLAVCHHDPAKWRLLRPALFHYFTFTNEFVARGTPYSFSWTLGVEEKFYLAWPLLYFVALRGRSRLVVVALLYPVLLGLLSYRMGRSYSGLLVGCLLAVFLSGCAFSKIKRVLVKTPVSIPAGLVIAFFCLVGRNERFTILFSWSLAALVAHLQLGDSYLRQAFGVKWLTWVGRRSYGMYLIHGLVLDAVESVVPPSSLSRQILVLALAFSGAALIAEPIFQFVEEPARRYGKSLIEQRAAAKSRASNASWTPARI
jgi:peptidoglycan/LPS O-acetylase OafA/YrhL